MWRILFAGVRYARLGAEQFPKLGHFIVENAAIWERLPPRLQRNIPNIQLPFRQRPRVYIPDIEAFTMSNVPPKVTGLPMVVYVSLKNTRHGPRLKVSKRYGKSVSFEYLFTITIEDQPRAIGKTGSINRDDVELAKRWITLNEDVLVCYWEQVEDFCTMDISLSLEKVERNTLLKLY